MTTTDIRNEQWQSLRGSLEGLRLAAYHAWIQHGPGTTAQVAAAAGLVVLTFRPRTTELLQLGLVKLVGRHKHEGIYAAVTETEWQQWRNEAEGPDGQIKLC